MKKIDWVRKLTSRKLWTAVASFVSMMILAELLPQVELSSNDLLIDMARIGLGIAFIPDFCLKHKPEDLFLVRTQETIPQRQLVASLNPTLPVSASTEEFLKLLPDV